MKPKHVILLAAALMVLIGLTSCHATSKLPNGCEYRKYPPPFNK